MMRRTPLARGTSTLKRSGFARKEGVFSSLEGKGIKRRVRKPTVAEGSKYLAACRGEPCYLRVVGVCCGDWETVVPCHDNRLSAGKGMGLKASHANSLPGCFTCHRWLDQGPAPREVKFAVMDAGMALWVAVRARKMGLYSVETM